MVEYRTSAHAVFDIKYHFVWITKYRYKILRERIAERARDLLRQICQAREAVIIRGGTGSHPHAGVGAAGHGAGQVGAVSEGAVIAEAPRRISGTAQALLGAALVSAGLFLRECGRGGRGNDQEIH
jgi:putative transposase